MLNRNKVDNGTLYMGEEELRNILRRYLYSYRFHFQGNNPDKVVIPMFSSVGGVDITYEPAEEQDPPEKDIPIKEAPKEVTNATNGGQVNQG